MLHSFVCVFLLGFKSWSSCFFWVLGFSEFRVLDFRIYCHCQERNVWVFRVESFGVLGFRVRYLGLSV